MTEKRGGSDVGFSTETIAINDAIGDANINGQFRLYGYKYFCSAADCDVVLGLARIIDTKD